MEAETHASFGDVVVVVHDVSGQSEVTDLHYLALREEDVPGGQVAVNALPKQERERRSVAALCILSQASSSKTTFHSVRYRLRLFL